MGVKATIIRDQYAEQLKAYMEGTPVYEWPRNGSKVSKAGLERIMRERGLSSFERKRLESAACRPLVKLMTSRIAEWVIEAEPAPAESAVPSQVQKPSNYPSSDSDIHYRRIHELEKQLAQAHRLLKKAVKRNEILESELNAQLRQQDAFQKFCSSSLRTLHVK